MAALIRDVAATAGIARRPMQPAPMARRWLLAMHAQRLNILDKAVARRADDVDLVLECGSGCPCWRGGPLWLAESEGWAKVADDLATLAGNEPRSWPMPRLLPQLVAEGKPLSSLDRFPNL